MYHQGFLKVQASSPAIIPGHLEHNKRQIIEVLNESKASILVFPELTISGYSVGDLFYQPAFLQACLNALNDILENHQFKGLFVLGMPLIVDGKIINSAVVIKGKNILGVVPKYHLPNTNEYYEKRWFDSGFKVIEDQVTILGQNVWFGSLIFTDLEKKLNVGVEICHDLWSLETPSDILASQGANVILNLSSSTEFAGKRFERENLVKSHSAKQKSLYVYASTGPFESVSDAVFSNHKMIVLNGQIIKSTSPLSHEEQHLVADVYIDQLNYMRHKNKLDYYHNDHKIRHVYFKLDETPDFDFETDFSKTPFLDAEPNLRFAADIQKVALAQKLRSMPKGHDHIILGISGGVDSTLALLASVEACDYLHVSRKKIIAVSMPSIHTSKRALVDAKSLANNLGVTFLEVSIEKELTVHLQAIEHQIKDVTYENAQARIRTLILMNLANKYQGFVLGTGDLSEIALGFMTYNGDQMSMYAINAGIPKTYAISLLKFHAQTSFQCVESEVNRVISAPISPELKDEQETEEKIGKYEINDFILYYTFINGFEKEAIVILIHKVFKMTKVKADQYVESFFARFFANQFKRQTLPEGPKVFEFSLNPRADYRMPSDIKRK